MVTMEFASRIRWILLIAVGVIALILVTWGLFTIASNIFRGSDSSDEADLNSSSVQLVETTAVARFEVLGPIVANEDQRSYEITVSQNVVTMKTYKNYGKTLIEEKSYQNTPVAYDNFLSALINLDVTDISRGASAELDFEDLGVCSNGRKYIVSLDSDTTRWSTSCNRNEGNAGFSMNPVGRLFQAQVPDFSDLTRGLGI
jgi:hypothetical protein